MCTVCDTDNCNGIKGIRHEEHRDENGVIIENYPEPPRSMDSDEEEQKEDKKEASLANRGSYFFGFLVISCVGIVGFL